MVQDRIATSANRVFLVSILLWLLVSAAVIACAGMVPGEYWWAIEYVIYLPSIIGFGVPSLFFVMKNKIALWREIYVGRMQILRVACMGLFVSLASVPLTLLNLYIIQIMGFDIPQQPAEIPQMSFLSYIAKLLILAALPAIVEETLFRGILQRANEPRLGKNSAVYAGIAFALMHFDPFRLLTLVAIGIFLGYLVYVTRSLLLAMVFHFVNNAVAVTLSFVLSLTGGDSAYGLLGDPREINVSFMIFISGMALIIFIMIYRQVLHFAAIRNNALNVTRNEIIINKNQAEAIISNDIAAESEPETPEDVEAQKKYNKIAAMSRVRYGTYVAAIIIEVFFMIFNNIQHLL